MIECKYCGDPVNRVDDDGYCQGCDLSGETPNVRLADRIFPKWETPADLLPCGPYKITEQQFYRAIGDLYPLNWVIDEEDGTESFQSPERLSGSTAAIYCRIGECYYRLNGHFEMTHEQITGACRRLALRKAQHGHQPHA